MKRSNLLASIFDWIGDALERFNPSAFRFLAASLPYLTPVPVAWLTSHSASAFLQFTPEVAFIFVFALEGIGLWFTTMLVDSVVDWVRSRNWKTFVPVVMFALAVTGYIFILVDLNVTLERATGDPDPALSRVITLLCFLPLITGIGNGYYKLKLEHKTSSELSRLHTEAVEKEIRIEQANSRLEELRIREENAARIEMERSKERLERLRIKAELSRNHLETSGVVLENSKKVSSGNGKIPEGMEDFEKVSDWRKIEPQLTRNQLERIANFTPEEMRKVAEYKGFSVRTISNWRSAARKKLNYSD